MNASVALKRSVKMHCIESDQRLTCFPIAVMKAKEYNETTNSIKNLMNFECSGIAD